MSGEQTTPSDDELARDDPDLCEHGWSRLHPQPCPECEERDARRANSLCSHEWAGSALGLNVRCKKCGTLPVQQNDKPSDQTTGWRRHSAIADYPGFNSYLEICGERVRFVIDAKIEHASEMPQLQEYINCMADILNLQRRQRPEDEFHFPDEGGL